MKWERLGHHLTVFVSGAAMVFAVSSVALLLKGTPPTWFFPVLPHVGIRITSVLLYSVLFFGVLAGRFRERAVLVLGLMWGSAELINNLELAVLQPWYVLAEVPHPTWWAYEGGVAVLAGISLLVLRKRIRGRVGLVCLVLLCLYAPVALYLGAPVPDIVTLQVLEFEIPWHLCIISSVLLTVRKS